MKYKRLMILFAGLSLLITAFIWGNSIQPEAQSSEQSSALASMLKPILDSNNEMDEDMFHNLLRKSAHFVEFGVLGLFVAGFTGNLGRMCGRRHYSLPLLTTLAVAVTDEYIQNFSGRGSLVTDVALDFSGALVGLGLAALVFLIEKHTKIKAMK